MGVSTRVQHADAIDVKERLAALKRKKEIDDLHRSTEYGTLLRLKHFILCYFLFPPLVSLIYTFLFHVASDI
jgi:hypothetical protein